MTQLLSGIYKLVRTGSLGEIDPYQVQEEKSSEFAARPIHCREDSLVIYGPHESKCYEVVLLKPMATATSEVYSIFRTSMQHTAEEIFLVLKDKLPFLLEEQKTSCSSSVVQKFSDIIRSNPGWNLMHISVSLGMKDLMNLPEVLSKVNEKCVHTGVTPLQLAIESKQIQIIQLIIELEADLTILNGNGDSVFHAAATSSKEIIEIISKKEIKTINLLNDDGQTPLHLACLYDKPDCVKALLRAGADINFVTSDKNSLVTTVNIDAEESSNGRSAGEIIDSHPDQLHTHDMKDGGTPLHWAKSIPVIEAFIEAGCQINAPNFNGDTALHVMVERERLSCVIGLLSNSANPNLKGSDGNTPLHLAVKLGNVPITEALLAFGSDVNAVNHSFKTPRHVAATTEYSSPGIASFISNSSNKAKAGLLLYTLHAVGARRCNMDGDVVDCNDGCLKDGLYDGIPPEPSPALASNDQFYDDIFNISAISSAKNSHQKFHFDDMDSSTRSVKSHSLLCLDGGGIRGLILIKMMMMLESFLGVPIKDCFDWFAGTSTGGILCLGLAVGKSITECLALYFRLKSKVFKGNRPYDSEALEEFLKKELGGDQLKMTDLNPNTKVMVTGVLADRLPAALHLFRSYSSPSDMLQELRMEDDISEVDASTSNFTVPPKPCDQPVWLAARATGAAPTYFRASGNIVDGGLISNNPTLDLLTEIYEYNKALKLLNKEDEVIKINCLLSLGTGKLPVAAVEDMDVFRPDSVWNAARAVRGMSALANLLVDQVTSSDGQVVKRAKAWCDMIGVPYIRLNPTLSSNVGIDETNNETLVHMLWETMAYMNQQKETTLFLKELLTRDLGKCL